MFKFRGQRKDNGEWVVGNLVELINVINGTKSKCYGIVDDATDINEEIHKESLSISFGKLDSNKQEIFASFEIDGVMTTGGDVVELKHIQGKQFKVQYSAIGCEFIMQRPDSDIVWNVSNAGQFEITIIGKGGGNDK